MKKLQYGMVGGGPGSFIGDAHRRCGIYYSIDEFRQHRKTIDVGMVL